MSSFEINFIDYDHVHFTDCLQLFDENCPQYFAENEKQDYSRFLESKPTGYFVVNSGKNILAAFGLIISTNTKPRQARLSWILVSPSAKGRGIGLAMMNHVRQFAGEQSVGIIDIAASHLSAPFFVKFGAVKLAEHSDGWGQGMHRVDMQLKV